MIILSDGDFQYEVVEGWARIPEDLHLGDVAAIALDRSENVYLFTRGTEPVIVLDPQGNVLRSWGHGMFGSAHGLDIGPDGAVYCTDVGHHVVRKFTPEGRLLLEIGMPGKPAPLMSGEPFRACTHTALAPSGEIYVSDGYGNARVHKYAPDGKLLLSWGECGSGAGEFYVPHNIVCDDEGWVYVADRENHRVQVFDGKGRYETQWNNMHRPCALCRGAAADGLFYIGELGPALDWTLDFPNLGPRTSIRDAAGNNLARLSAGPAGIGAGRFIAPHGIAVTAGGDIYVGEVSYAAWRRSFPAVEKPSSLPTLHKLRRIHAPGGSR